MASILQSKLNRLGHITNQKLKTGKNIRVKSRVINESLAEAGLSALANFGGLKPINWPRRTKRPKMAEISQNMVTLSLRLQHKLLIRHTPSTVMPCSLQNMAKVAQSTVKTKNGLFESFLVVVSICWLKDNSPAKKKIPARISARPTIPATASV